MAFRASHIRRQRFIIAIATTTLLLIVSTVALADIRPNSLGFYPIWENTGVTDHDGKIYLGTSSAHVAYKDAQIGIQPINFAYRTPNVYGKLRVFTNEQWSVAGQVSYFHLMEAASRAYLSPMYTSRLDNSDFDANLATLAVAATQHLTPRFALHHAVTALGMFMSTPLKSEVTFGYSIVAELSARPSHSLLLHAGEIGIWNHDFAEFGASYRFQGEMIEFRFGYFYRLRTDSSQSAPMISLGMNF